jgi:hypothetical protein
MNNSSVSPKNDPASHKWIVDFTDFRTRDEAQRGVISELREMAFEVVKVWLQVVTPGAVIVGPSEQSVRLISFCCRSHMRRFLRTFGGRQVRQSKNTIRS